MNKLLKYSAVVTALSLGIMTSASADKILLKIPFGFNPKLPGVSAAANILSKNLPAANSSIKVKIYNPGKLVPPFEILDAVSSGKVNAGFATAAYWGGKIPAAALYTAIPFGPEVPELTAWYKYGNGGKLHQELYTKAGYKVHVMLCGVLPGATGGWFNKEINKPSDFKGLKMRALGYGGHTMTRLGIAQMVTPVGEIYPALEKGVIDAAELSNPAVDNMVGLPKVSKYGYFPGWQKQTVMFELLINSSTWAGLDEGQKATIEMACTAAIAQSMAQSEFAVSKAMAAIEARAGTEIRQFPVEVLTALENAWQEVAAEETAKDPMFKKIFGDLTAFRSNYKIWSKNAYLPRK